MLKLNSSGGAKYSGFWKDDKKHGYGIIIGVSFINQFWIEKISEN